MSTLIVEPTLQNQDLFAILAQVFHPYLSQEVQLPSSAALPPDPDAMIAAVVSVTGGWTGHVRLDCTYATAAALRAVMRDLPAGAPDGGDAVETLAALASIVAGRIKALVPAPAGLGLPVIAIGAQHLRLPHCTEANRLTVAWNGNGNGNGETLQVRILKPRSKTDPAT